MDRILLIDDDIELCELVGEFLTSEGFTVTSVHDGEQGVNQVLANDYGLIVLDVMLPSLNGFEVLRRVRSVKRTPIIMLTARGEDVDRIIGLELGADDYLPKPFNPRELVARIRAVLRRMQPTAPKESGEEKLIVGEIELSKSSRVVRCNGLLIDLTSAEFDLLELLMQAAGKVVTREEIARLALGKEYSPFDRSIDMHVSNLRKKIGERNDGIERIKSVRGIGYIYTR
ncbi:MAG: response regulator transcription factor [Acidobacteria bacterium]|nr:response regulator transcription factor [Acidobacteriota bacterium]